MVQSHIAILAEKLMALNPKDKVPLHPIEEGLLGITSSALLINDNCSIYAILQGKRTSVLFNISDFLIIDIKELSIVEVVLIVLEVFQPGLVIRDNFPVTFP